MSTNRSKLPGFTHYGQEYTKYQASRGILRKYLRSIYIKPLLKLIDGKSIDFGCGVGDLLHKLPKGSLGIEINESSYSYCLKRGLHVILIDPIVDNYQLMDIDPSEGFTTLIMSHVLEHLEEVDVIFPTILKTANRIGINKIIIIVPGMKGFKSDSSHKSYIDEDFFLNNGFDCIHGFEIKTIKKYPLNFDLFRNIFRFHELWIIYEKCSPKTDSE